MGPDGLSYALTVASCVALLVRRRHPVVVFVIVWPLTMWHSLVPYTAGMIDLVDGVSIAEARPLLEGIAARTSPPR